MARRDGQAGASTPPEAVQPGTLTALLREIVQAPEEEKGGAWDNALRPGAVVGRFELVREIGRGGFGVVWEAKDRDLGRSVAFKAVRAGDGTAVREERLLREAETAARLSHPNIVTLFDVGRSEQGPFLVLELLRGRTLAQRLEQGPIAVPEALRIGVEVAKGLAHAHAQGVVHRDLTPRNVFLCDDGQVKVLDLGLAHAFGSRRVDGGTPGYMAPEQRRGAPEDERTDVFALGVMLFRMLAGELPFPPDGGRRRTAPALDVPGAPALGPLVRRMLERDPVDRPRDAAEALDALGAFQLELARSAATPGKVRTRRTRPAGAAPSVAVLPFADLSPGKDQEYFADGVAEEIRGALARVQGLDVVGRTSSFSFKGKDENLRTIGRKLGVATVLEGSVRKDGDRVRVAVQLVKAADGYHLWSETYDRELGGIFALQDEIARAVVAKVTPVLAGAGPGAPAAPPATSPEAYDRYLRGRQALRAISLDGARRALAEFERAVALDEGHAPSWAGLAEAALWVTALADEPQPVAARALPAAERAIALAPDGAEGLRARGRIRRDQLYDWDGALADLRRAIALAPSDAETATDLGFLLGILGLPEEGLALQRRACALDPLSVNAWWWLGAALTNAGALEEGRSALERALQLAPDFSVAVWALAVNRVLAGSPEAALAEAGRPTERWVQLLVEAVAHHSLGHPGASSEALDRLAAELGGVAAYQVAEAHAWRGEVDRAFGWLERARVQHDPGLVFVKRDPLLRALHPDPRWKPFLGAMNVPVD